MSHHVYLGNDRKAVAVEIDGTWYDNELRSWDQPDDGTWFGIVTATCGVRHDGEPGWVPTRSTT